MMLALRNTHFVQYLSTFSIPKTSSIARLNVRDLQKTNKKGRWGMSPDGCDLLLL